MKYGASVKRICGHCQIIKRNNRLTVICPRNPRHKQKQG